MHRALDRRSGQTVAVKVLHLVGADARRRFMREAHTLARLDHPAIVRHVDHGVDAEARPYLVMEWLEGVTLDHRLARGSLAWPEAVSLARKLAGALGALHARMVVHRDVKPTNVFLVGDDIERPKLLDLGVAHVAMTSLVLTHTGSIIGTPDYMSPEQARAERAIGPAADVFSLGCLLYHALAGEPPFAGSRAVAVLAKILFSEPEPLAESARDAPADLVALIERMLAKEPNARPRDGRALEAELAAVTLEPRRPAELTRETSRPRLGAAESQVVSVVLTGQAIDVSRFGTGAGVREEVETAIDVRPRVASLVGGTLGATVHALAHGGLVATVRGGVSAVEQVASACRLALRMRELMPDTSIVVATGRGVITERAPVGEVIERAAAQLEGLAAGTVGIDEATAGLLDARFVLSGSEGALILAGERARSEAVRRFLGRETEMVGRARELRALEGLVAQCAEDSVARAALVLAPPGLGKSRLRYELVRRVRERWPDMAVWVGWGDPMRGSPFATLAEAVRRELDLGEGDDASLARARLHARAGRFFRGQEQEDVAAFLGEMIGVPFDDADHPGLRAARRDPELMRERIRHALESWLGRETERPILIVLEDLQWADAASLELLDSALGALAERPLVVLGLGHPELRERMPELWARRGLDVIVLRELSAKASEQMVRAALPEASDETVERVVRLGEGNAF